MSKKTWTGAGSAAPRIENWAIGSSTVGQTFTATSPNGSVATYTAVTGDTTSTIATGLADACAAITDGQFTELTFAASGANMTVTGPSDGAPFTLTSGGTGTTTVTVTQTQLSPHDYTRAANWLGGVAPVANDDIVFDTGSVDVLYNLDGFTGTVFTSWKRLYTYTGKIGLPDTSSSGYREYRPTHCEVDSTSIRVEQSQSDGDSSIRVKATNAGATTVTVTGAGAVQSTTTWLTEVYNLPASSIVLNTGGSLAIAPYASQTATVATLTSTNGALRVGAGTTLTTPTIKGGVAEIATSYTTLTVDTAATVTVTTAAAAATSTDIESGTVIWVSTGTPGAVTLGTDGILDLSQCPQAVAVGTITTRGGRLYDPNGRLTKPYTFSCPNHSISEVSPDFGTGFTLTVN